MIRRHKLTEEDSDSFAKKLEDQSRKKYERREFSDLSVQSDQKTRKIQADIPDLATEDEKNGYEKEFSSLKETVYEPEAAAVPAVSGETAPAERSSENAAEAAPDLLPSENEEDKETEYVFDGDRPEDVPSDIPFPAENEDEYVAKRFVGSLQPLKGKKRRLKKSRKKVIRAVLLCVFITVFLVSVFMISKDFFYSLRQSSIYSDLQDDFFEGIVSSSNTASPAVRMKIDSATPAFGEKRSEKDSSVNIPWKTNSQFKQFQTKLTSMKIENPDTVGWLQVDGTNSKYAGVQGYDNAYYLDHDFRGRYNPLGSIFADYRNNENFLENYNTIIYGHNAAYLNQMFNQLSNLLDRETFEKNRYITVYTTYGILTYETFSLYETDLSFNYYATYFYSGYSFISWANAIRDSSIYQRDNMAPFTPNDRILTLSTCTNGPSTRRYVVHARLVSIEGD